MMMGGKNEASGTIINRTGREGRAGDAKQAGKWWRKYGTMLRLNSTDDDLLVAVSRWGTLLTSQRRTSYEDEHGISSSE